MTPLSGHELPLRRRKLLAQLRQRRAEVRAKLHAYPLYQRNRRRRRLRLLIGLVLMWLLLRQCQATDVPPPPAEQPTPERQPLTQHDSVPVPAPEAKPNKPPSRVRMTHQPRADYQSPPPQSEPWLSELRLQVAARSPLLARCFEGTEQPGALQWTAVVDLKRGVVSDHTLAPTLTGAALTQAMQTCLVQALSTPRYQFTSATKATLTPRISMVLEF